MKKLIILAVLISSAAFARTTKDQQNIICNTGLSPASLLESYNSVLEDYRYHAATASNPHSIKHYENRVDDVLDDIELIERAILEHVSCN